MIRIRFDREAMIAGEPCVEVDGQFWTGFETTRGVIFIRTGEGHAWLEFHGDREWIREGGRVVTPARPDAREVLGMNYWLSEELDRVAPPLVIGAVNRQRVADAQLQAVTVYRAEARGINSQVCEWARFEMNVRSVVVIPPARGPGEPLNCWIETRDTGLVEVH